MLHFLCAGGDPARRVARRASTGMLLALVTAGLAGSAVATGEAPHRVLIIHSFGRDFGPFYRIASELHRQLTAVGQPPIDLYEVSQDTARWGEDESVFADFLARRFAERRLDLVITLGAPACQFALRQRPRLLETTPLLVAGVDERFLEAVPLTALDAASPARVEVKGEVELLLELLPDTREVVLVYGTSPLERRWTADIQRQLEPLSSRLKVSFWSELSLDEMVARARKLTRGSVILYGMLIVDGAGITHERDRGLTALRAAANVPIGGLLSGQVGMGSLGGLVVDEVQIASSAARAALRILGGTAPSSVRPPTIRARPIFDARELKRWDIPVDRLPPGSELQFRPPSMWREHRAQTLSIVAVLVLQGLLIAGLLFEWSRRRDAERKALLLSRRLLTAHEDERRHLARELHDDLTQRLARLSIDAARIEMDSAEQRSREQAHVMRGELARLGDDVHALSYRLHPAVLEDLGLHEALKSEADRFARSSGVEVALSASELPASVSDDVALCLYRVAQEALRNVGRHAGARHVELSLVGRPDALELAIRDDGVGLNGATREGPKLGLASMRERVGALGGRLMVQGGPRRGTTIIARVPHTQPAVT